MFWIACFPPSLCFFLIKKKKENADNPKRSRLGMLLECPLKAGFHIYPVLLSYKGRKADGTSLLPDSPCKWQRCCPTEIPGLDDAWKLTK